VRVCARERERVEREREREREREKRERRERDQERERATCMYKNSSYDNVLYPMIKESIKRSMV
jgi:hypothetical protein